MSKEDPGKVRARVKEWRKKNQEKYNEYQRVFKSSDEQKKKRRERDSTAEAKERKRLFDQAYRERKRNVRRSD